MLHHIVVFFYCSYHCLFLLLQLCGGDHLTTGESQYPRIYRPRVRIQYPDRICRGQIVSASVIDPVGLDFRGDRIRYDTGQQYCGRNRETQQPIHTEAHRHINSPLHKFATSMLRSVRYSVHLRCPLARGTLKFGLRMGRSVTERSRSLTDATFAHQTLYVPSPNAHIRSPNVHVRSLNAAFCHRMLPFAHRMLRSLTECNVRRSLNDPMNAAF